MRVGQWVLVASAILLLTAIDPELASPAFGIGMFAAGAGLGLLASQLGNVNMSAVTAKDTSEVGGLQGVFQNLGSSLGTALIGSILIGALASSFASGVAQSTLPDETQAIVNEQTAGGVEIVPASSVQGIAEESGLSDGGGRRARGDLRRVAALVAAHRVLRTHPARTAVAARLARHPGRGAAAAPVPREGARGRQLMPSAWPATASTTVGR